MPKEIPYFRDVPCDNDLYKAYYIGYKYNIIKNKTDILGAIILKWLKEGKIRIEVSTIGTIWHLPSRRSLSFPTMRTAST